MRLRRYAEVLGPRGQLAARIFDEAEQEDFLNVAWQEIDDTRALTPPDAARTLGAVAKRVIDQFGGIEGLARAGRIAGALNPDWFAPCLAIEQEGFDWSKMLRPWIVPAFPSEMRFSPHTYHYLCEGTHSSLVLAVALLEGSRIWRPVEVITAFDRLE